jgi:hypothetical protein
VSLRARLYDSWTPPSHDSRRTTYSTSRSDTPRSCILAFVARIVPRLRTAHGRPEEILSSAYTSLSCSSRWTEAVQSQRNLAQQPASPSRTSRDPWGRPESSYAPIFQPIRPSAAACTQHRAWVIMPTATRRLHAHGASLPALSRVAAVHWPPSLQCVEGIYIAPHLRAIAIMVYEDERRTACRHLRPPERGRLDASDPKRTFAFGFRPHTPCRNSAYSVAVYHAVR